MWIFHFTGTLGTQDKYLARKYDLESFVRARRECKAALQKKMGLVVTPNAVSRLQEAF